jgi:hypothetical protein
LREATLAVGEAEAVAVQIEKEGPVVLREGGREEARAKSPESPLLERFCARLCSQRETPHGFCAEHKVFSPRFSAAYRPTEDQSPEVSQLIPVEIWNVRDCQMMPALLLAPDFCSAIRASFEPCLSGSLNIEPDLALHPTSHKLSTNRVTLRTWIIPTAQLALPAAQLLPA